MKCCIECFKDSEIRAIIRTANQQGTCDFCLHTHTYVYDLEEETALTVLFDEFLEIFTPLTSLPSTYPHNEAGLLSSLLFERWAIFSGDSDQIQRLLTYICREKYRIMPKLFEEHVGVSGFGDDGYLNEHAILKTYGWHEFVKEIKEHNRFHTNYMNKPVLQSFLECVKVKYPNKSIFFRSRLCSSPKGHPRKRMGAPPIEKASAGRVNPEGIRMLYLSDSAMTTLYEVRAGMYDYVTVGTFVLQQPLNIINLAEIDSISPFLANTQFGIDFMAHAVNLPVLRMLAQSIARPLRSQDSALEYLPTQYISDYIKSLGYDGIEYVSTMSKDGRNIAIFREDRLTCTSTKVLDIQSISYQYQRVTHGVYKTAIPTQGSKPPVDAILPVDLH